MEDEPWETTNFTEHTDYQRFGKKCSLTQPVNQAGGMQDAVKDQSSALKDGVKQLWAEFMPPAPKAKK